MNNFAGIKIEEKTIGKNVVFSITGEIVITNADRMQGRVLERINEGEKDIILDLREVPYIDSFGRGAIVKINNELERKGGRLLILMKENHVKEEFDACQFNSFMTITIDSRIIEDAAA